MKKAFTLLEMLVVIGIISVLLSMGFVSYSTSQKKARDARRQSDLKALQATLEQCYSVGDYLYPTFSGGTSLTVDCSADGGPSLTISDPLGQTYTVVSTTDGYSITVNLETSTDDYTVTNQQ